MLNIDFKFYISFIIIVLLHFYILIIIILCINIFKNFFNVIKKNRELIADILIVN